MTVYIASRHAPTIDYLRERYGLVGQTAEHVDERFIAALEPGDCVVGSLPAHLAAKVAARGARYSHIVMDVPRELRGVELDAAAIARIAPTLAPVAFAAPGKAVWTLRMRRRALRVRRRMRDGVGAWPALAKWALAAGAGIVLTKCGPLTADKLWSAASCLASGCAAGQTAGAAAQGALSFGAVMLAIGALAALSQSILSTRARRLQPGSYRARALIVGLSPPNRAGAGPYFYEIEQSQFSGDARGLAAPGEEFEKAPAFAVMQTKLPAYKASNWQQMVRAILPHIGRLERILVLPSDGSTNHFEAFVAYAQAIFGGELRIDRVVDHVGAPFRVGSADTDTEEQSYENYDYVTKGLDRAVEQLREADDTLGEEDICIDATAGIKMFAAGATVVTLNRKLRMSYVSNAGEQKLYDLEIEIADYKSLVQN